MVDGHRPSPFRRVASSSHAVNSVFVDRGIEWNGIWLALCQTAFIC